MEKGQKNNINSSVSERRILSIAFWLNTALSGSLLIAGLVANSSGLIANALDNASDAAIYAVSYYAVNRGLAWKIRAAQLSGVMLLIFSISVIFDVIRRFLSGTEPIGIAMVVMTVIAAGINITCIKLLHKFRQGDVNFRAVWEFSINDLFANLGVLIAGIMVALLNRPWPDLVVGLAIALFAAKGSIKILLDAQRTNKKE